MIDLTKPIEAVHKDGRVVPMELDRWVSRHAESFFTAPNSEVGNRYHWKLDGSPVSPSNPWTIRNVAEHETDADNTPHTYRDGAPDTCRHCGNSLNHAVHQSATEPEQLFDPDDWAIEEALKRGEWVDVDAANIRVMASLGYTSYRCVLVIARMIQKYEPHLKPKPPVDPDIAAVREILAAWGAARIADNDPDFLAAVAAFKRVKGGWL